MALADSQMLELGTRAPEFSLPDAEGNIYSLRDDASAYVVMFICNRCPFVKHIREELARLGDDCLSKNVAVYGINSNDATRYPGDSPAMMLREIETYGYRFPYLIDEDQSIAKAYRAACTPDIYLFNGAKKLVYRGQLDDSRPSNNLPVDGSDLRTAIDAVLSNSNIEPQQKPSIGCSIKWQEGNAPDYFG
ncbi:MAG: thioredoxin family protein [Woeseiaceae bacterium]